MNVVMPEMHAEARCSLSHWTVRPPSTVHRVVRDEAPVPFASRMDSLLPVPELDTSTDVRAVFRSSSSREICDGRIDPRKPR